MLLPRTSSTSLASFCAPHLSIELLSILFCRLCNFHVRIVHQNGVFYRVLYRNSITLCGPIRLLDLKELCTKTISSLFKLANHAMPESETWYACVFLCFHDDNEQKMAIAQSYLLLKCSLKNIHMCLQIHCFCYQVFIKTESPHYYYCVHTNWTHKKYNAKYKIMMLTTLCILPHYIAKNVPFDLHFLVIAAVLFLHHPFEVHPCEHHCKQTQLLFWGTMSMEIAGEIEWCLCKDYDSVTQWEYQQQLT